MGDRFVRYGVRLRPILLGTGLTLGVALGCAGVHRPLDACHSARGMDWNCVRENTAGWPALVGEDVSPAACRGALTHYTACLETGDLSEGWDGLQTTLDRINRREDLWRDAQAGTLVLLGSYLMHGRTGDASRLLAGLQRVRESPEPRSVSSELAPMIDAAGEWLPLVAARLLLRDGLSLSVARQPMLPPPSEAQPHRLFVVRLRVEGFECTPCPWGEVELFHLALQHRLARAGACVQVVPFEVAALVASRLGAGYEIDSLETGPQVATLAWNLGCDAVLVPVALCDAGGVRDLHAYLYVPGKPPRFERGIPEVLRYQRSEFRVVDQDLLSPVDSLGEWVRDRLAPDCEVTGNAGGALTVPPALRVQLSTIASLLAAGNAEGAQARLVQLRRSMKASRAPKELLGFANYLAGRAASRAVFGTSEEFHDRALQRAIARWREAEIQAAGTGDGSGS